MAIEKGVLATVATVAGAAFVGLVGYKIVKKKKPKVLDKIKRSVQDMAKKPLEIIEGAKKSFREGYAKA